MNPAPTPRQQDVLDASLQLLVDKGEALTMTAVARRASCSKETLYKWFGDRDGLLTATVRWQALKVHVPPVERASLDRRALTASLEQFAINWLTVITSETSIALNRVAVAHAGSDKKGLGAIVLENGRLEMGRRLKPVLEAGRDAGLLAFDDPETAFRTFFGLVGRDVQVRLLLGERLDMAAPVVAADAARAATQFLQLYGTAQHIQEPENHPGRKNHARLL
ncbi:TetR/AcrR family transcriptional regulator [Mesorhizobium sp. NBSH29]|uniref:TetR/AcrR family transcriptional regulator n=1 Tax=Mesorhizobium sp. NBSH29 TaxID=2654249 RepID=UPI0021561385|nr:TetR/AcrR family transcriptional regulator [Mesorhizobium sp. NBSH29]